MIHGKCFFLLKLLHASDIGIVIGPRFLLAAPPILALIKRIDGIGSIPCVLHAVAIVDTGLGRKELGAILQAHG
jgi:hypothetical protein